MFPRLRDYPYIFLDTETTDLAWWVGKVFGVSISAPDGQDWYWDIRTDPGALEFLQDELPHAQLVAAHNMKFDFHMCREVGIHLPKRRLSCSMIRAALIDEHLFSYDLDSLGKKYVGIGKMGNIWQELAAIFGGKATASAQAPNLHRAPKSLVGRYAKQDTRTGIKLWEWQNPVLDDQELRRVEALEMRLLPAVIAMEHGGVRVDVEQAQTAVEKLSKAIKTLRYQLDSLAGFPVNPNPSNSIKELFKPTQNENGDWVVVDGTVVGKTESGAPSLDAAALRSMKHPAAAMILQCRKLIKTKDTFLMGHVLGHHHDGVVHANINQTKSDNDLGTGTGRFSINDPALQQIHKRDVDIAAIVRAVFLPDHGRVWVCNDWAQMDFRMFAHYAKNPQVLEMYAKDPNTDFHKLAAGLTGLPRSPRFAGDANAKQINLGLVFGMGQGKLAAEMGLPYTVEKSRDGRKEWLKPGPEAMAVFDRYHAAIPGVKTMLENATSVAKSRGHVRTVMGRRIRFPGGQFTHKAGGLIFQGTAADALKLKICEVHEYLEAENNGSRLMLNVHDEFDSSVPPGDTKTMEEISRIVTTFDKEIKFRVPIRTEQGVGPNWWEACK